MSHEIVHWTMEYNPNNIKKEMKNRRTLQAEADEYAAHVDWEEGCSGLYNGIRWLEGKPYDNYSDALNAIEELDRGSYDNLAVLYRDYDKVKPTKKMETLKARSAELGRKKEELDKTSTKELHTRKSAFIGCKNCGSKLSTKYIRNSVCPLCGNELRSDTTMNRLANMTKKIKEINKEYIAEEKKLKAKAEVRWLVKFEFHC